MVDDDDGDGFPSPEPKTDSRSALPRKNRAWCRGSKSDSRVGVGMERQGPSYGEVVSTRDVRVQALLGGSKSPTSRSPERTPDQPSRESLGLGGGSVS